MHDWVLVDIIFKWEEGGNCQFLLRDSDSNFQHIHVYSVRELIIPRKEDWGPSNSINSVRGPLPDGNKIKLEIEMQSGDIIVVSGDDIELPKKTGKTGVSVEIKI